jgi:hypothetical protein
MCQGLCEDKFFGPFIPREDTAGKRARTAKKVNRDSKAANNMRRLYLMPPPVNGYERGPPSVPLPFSTLKTENKEATTMNNVEPTKCLPGQTRFPNPNVDVKTGSSRRLPSALRNRSGLKASGSGYVVGSCKIALKIDESKPKYNITNIAPCVPHYQRA